MPKTGYSMFAAAAILSVTLAGSVAAQEKAAAPSTTQQIQPAQQTRELRRALHSLYVAGRQLTRAPKDAAGHRDKAFDLVKQAQAEIRSALPPRPPRQGGSQEPGKASAAPAGAPSATQ